MFISVPTYKDGEWVENTHFETREQFRDFLLALFKEPGQYGFDIHSLIFNEQARIFEQQKYYCSAPMGTKDYIRYWDREKEKCRRGLLVHSGEKTWYLTRDYYMWLNFLPIFNKEEAKFGFAKIRDAQYHMALYEILAELHYKHCAIVKKRQIASEQPHSEPVLGEHGWTTMGDIQPGDKLWNPDGTLTTILHKSNNGLSEVYEFEFGDGRKTRCGIEHNWEVYDRLNNKKVVLNTRQLLDKGILRSPVKGVKKTYDNYRFAISACEAIPFINHEKLPIDPYVLGCILGDGHINRTVYIAGKDEEIFEEIQLSLGSDYELVNNGYCKKLIKYKKRFSEDCLKYNNGKYGCNPLLRAFDELGLRKDDKGIKHIPEIYKHSRIEDRIALLQGLMDTDGYINSQGNNIHFTNTNKQLIDDVAYVARSLGLKVSITEKNNGRQNKFYRLLFSGEVSIELFRLTRKQNRLVKRFGKKTFNLIPLISIQKLDYLEESSCIVVDNPNHLYITRNFIVTHNSYFHAAKLINQLWFEEGVTLKMGASWKDYINEKGTWKFIEEYESFLNSNTAWYRPMNPRKILMWQQKIEIETNIGGKKRKSEKGLKGTLQGMSFEKDPTNGVGGPCLIFFHEEGGIAPKADQTYEYIRPALKSGFIYTGIFIIAGSVGDLDQCGPLKEFMLRPDPNDMYAVESNLITNNGLRGRSALFIPEHWSMPPYIDEYGNSLIEESLKALDDQYAIWKKELSPEVYQLRISQHPRTLEEAFAARTHSKFPQHLIAHQELKIQNKDYPYEFVDLSYDANDNIVVTTTNKLPISDFPVDKKMEDKSGSIVVWERPDRNAPFATYYASIDPVSQGRTTTSESLCSIYIYKNPIEISTVSAAGTETRVERDKIVAAWCGRFEDINKTHMRLQMMIEWYNAWTLVENNVSLFIQHMIDKKKQKYLVPKNQVAFFKDIQTTNTYQEYGWRNTGRIFYDHLLSYGIEFLKEEIELVTKPDGEIVKRIFGIERIPDPMLLKEMKDYQEDLNVDRLVSFCALIAFAKIQQANRGYGKKVEYKDKALEPSDKFSKLSMSPFRHLGGNSRLKGGQRPPRNPYKNLR